MLSLPVDEIAPAQMTRRAAGDFVRVAELARVPPAGIRSVANSATDRIHSAVRRDSLWWCTLPRRDEGGLQCFETFDSHLYSRSF